MRLTATQKAALKTDLAANTATVLIGGTPTQIKDVPHTPDAAFAVAAWYNLAASPAFFVWRPDVSVDLILNGLNYANFTPNDTPAQATEVNGQTWENRAMLVQIKQINLQLMIQGRTTFDATKANLRTGLQDATEFLPTGNNGNNRAGGWNAILPSLSRAATSGEKLFATGGDGQQATPATPGVDEDGRPALGNLTPQEITQAWEAP